MEQTLYRKMDYTIYVQHSSFLRLNFVEKIKYKQKNAAEFLRYAYIPYLHIDVIREKNK